MTSDSVNIDAATQWDLVDIGMEAFLDEAG